MSDTLQALHDAGGDGWAGKCQACIIDRGEHICGLQNGDPRFLALLDEMAELHRKKAADYGRGDDIFANVRASEELGIPAWKGVMVRMMDKVHRIKSYCHNGKLENEGVEDTLKDLAAYSLIALVLLREGTKPPE